mmetsp:Transcript_52061/g.62651  ORF Transcript_52061/g.62651 Transcript_52061/m.62651 type:complete len:81 (-) Transcript_52061:322-564(-)
MAPNGTLLTTGTKHHCPPSSSLSSTLPQNWEFLDHDMREAILLEQQKAPNHQHETPLPPTPSSPSQTPPAKLGSPRSQHV